MARPVGLRSFYLVLVVIAIAGGGWIWLSARQAAGGPMAEPLPDSVVAAAADFGGYVLGSDSAPFEVVEFADFQCPACAQFAILTMHDVKQRLISAGRVRWRFRDFPLAMHRNSRLAHHAAACAGEQGRFWEMHDQLFYNQGSWAPERNPARRFREYAGAAGLDATRYEECMDSGRYRARVEASVRTGEQLAVSSTPTFIVGNRRYPGMLTFDQVRTLVDSLAPPPPR